MSDTPENDKNVFPDFERGGDVVLADFARELERDRDKWKREAENAKQDHAQADTDAIRALHERNEARSQRDRLADALRGLRRCAVKYKLEDADLCVEVADAALAALDESTQPPAPHKESFPG